MATQLQIRRGTSAQVAAFTGAEGEVVVNTTNDSIHVNDGSTAGGFELARADLNNVSDSDLNAALTGNTVSALTVTALTTGSITTTGNISFGDNDKAIFGAGSDLQIYHDGSNSYISDQGTGSLRIAAQDFRVRNAANNAAVITGLDGAGVFLYYDGAEKLATTSTGIDVTGTVTADGLTVTGTLGNWSIDSQGAIQTFTRASTNYIRASNAAGALRFDTGGSIGRLNIASNGDISFYNSSGTSQSLFWDASAESLGIGTTSPRSILDLDGGSETQLRLQTTNTGSASSDGLLISLDASANANAFLWNYENAAMIFGTNAIERMRIDASGNLLVGKTSAAISSDGVEARNNGLLVATRDNNKAAILNRRSSDGDILEFNRGGSPVGSIGTAGAGLTIGKGDTGVFFDAGNNNIRPFNLTTNTSLDAAIDLGRSSTRFKDLYLSGGAYLGGTAAANKLDDYEEGTWTPTLDNGAGDLSATNLAFNASGRYTKIGRVVYITGVVSSSGTVTGTSSSPVKITGLPFTVGGISAFGGAFVDDSPSYNKPSVRTTSAEFEGSATVISLKKDGTNNEANFLTSDLSASGNSNRIYVSGFYTV